MKRQIDEICEVNINELYMKAFDRVKKTFKQPGDLIEWVSWIRVDASSFTKNFKFIGEDKDLEMTDFFYLHNVTMLGIAWFKDDTEGIKRELREILHYGGAEEFYHTIMKGLAVCSHSRLNGGIDSLNYFSNNFICWVDVCGILEEIEAIEDGVHEEIRQHKAIV